MAEVDCPDCMRGILCPDWDEDNHCSAGIQKSLHYKLRELTDAIELEHSGNIYDAGDYREVIDEMLEKLKPLYDKAAHLDRIMEWVRTSTGPLLIRTKAENDVLKEKFGAAKTWINLNADSHIWDEHGLKALWLILEPEEDG